MGESEASKAARYEKRYPGATEGDESKAAARMDRMDFKERQREGRRGSRYVSVPELPWHRERG
jgi:hypothetical protein